MTRSTTLLVAALLVARGALATTYEVKIGAGGNNSYTPQTLPALAVGDAVLFTWVSGVHPTMSDASPAAWPTFTLSSGSSSQTITFTKAGSYPYHCTAHAYQNADGSYGGMIGTITVQAALATLTAQTPAPSLSVYPNPARGQTNVQVSGPGGADYKLRLSNILGGEVRRMPVRPENAPSDGVALDLSNLPPGLYFCSLLVNDKTLVTKRLTVL